MIIQIKKVMMQKLKIYTIRGYIQAKLRSQIV